MIAVDCPSGLDCDTGELDPLTLEADETVTFGAAKPGLLTFPGAEAVGVLHIANIGLDPALETLAQVKLELATAETVRAALPERPATRTKAPLARRLWFLVA
ncbi:MAG: hypothetical protein HC915_02740 [Anaerolineae bacterium]|nr:hypothetical protein [Anaerolineae bacterium]